MPKLYEIQAAAVQDGMETGRITRLPILLLSVHSRCNCRCVMCDIWKSKDGREFHAVDLERHREGIRALAVERVVLSGGEPLLNGEMGAICEFFHELGVRVTLLTTGLLLEKRADLVAAMFDDAIVSLDGPAEIHDRVRQVSGAFRLIERGLKALRARRPEMQISCRSTFQKLNHAHLRATVAAAQSLGFDSISFLPVDLSSAAFNREERWSAERQDEVSLSIDEVNVLEAEIEMLIETHSEDIRTGFVAENAEKLRRIAMRFREHVEGTRPKSPMCNAPWVSAVVEVGGDVRPCFFHEPVGNIFQTSLEGALNSAAALAFRDHLDVATNPVCQRCVCSLNYRG